MGEQDISFGKRGDIESLIKVIGIGNGGCKAVNFLYHDNIWGVDFIICNTSSDVLQTSAIPNRIQLSNTFSSADGNLMSLDTDHNAVLETIEDIKKVVGDKTKMVILAAGMGGKTGIRAVPVIADACTGLGILTVCILTLPFTFEGADRWKQSVEGINNLINHVDCLLILHNDTISEGDDIQTRSSLLHHVDKRVALTIKSIAEIITGSGYICVDIEDVKSALSKSGIALIGSGVSSGKNRAQEAVNRAISSPLLIKKDLKNAKNILLNIRSGEEDVTLDEIGLILEFLQKNVGTETSILWGYTNDMTLGETLSVTIVVTGLEQEFN